MRYRVVQVPGSFVLWLQLCAAAANCCVRTVWGRLRRAAFYGSVLVVLLLVVGRVAADVSGEK
jgi:hypothetical protein